MFKASDLLQRAQKLKLVENMNNNGAMPSKALSVIESLKKNSHYESNYDQSKMVEKLKELSESDEPEANKFMEMLDKQFSDMTISKNEDDGSVDFKMCACSDEDDDDEDDDDDDSEDGESDDSDDKEMEKFKLEDDDEMNEDDGEAKIASLKNKRIQLNQKSEVLSKQATEEFKKNGKTKKFYQLRIESKKAGIEASRTQQAWYKAKGGKSGSPAYKILVTSIKNAKDDISGYKNEMSKAK